MPDPVPAVPVVDAGAAPVAPAAPVPSPTPTPEPPLAELIRHTREARAAREAKEAEAGDWKSKYEDAAARLAKLDKADMVNDPLGFAEAHGLTPDEMALVGETYLYNLIPDRAPADFRIRLLQVQQARKDRQAEERSKASESDAQRREAHQMVTSYVDALGSEVGQLTPEAFPDSQAWFGEDRDTYVQSLFHTANNLAEAASAVGKQADLSFKAVADALEADINARMERRSKRGAAPAQQSETKQVEPAPQGQSGRATQPVAVGATSATSLGGNGVPRPPALTEAERLRRAIEHGFASR